MATGKRFQDLDLSNAFLFAAALEDEETCKMIIELILGMKIPKIHVKMEHSILYNADFRSIRLDIYASDETQVDYNLEMQNENENNLPKRSRFHQAQLDATALKPGQLFNELQSCYIIFICSFDPFGKGLYRYTFEERCQEEDFSLNDGAKRIFLNTRGTNEEDVPVQLIHFLRYVENSTEECVSSMQDSSIQKIHERVTYLKTNHTLEASYMTGEEWLMYEKSKGRAEGLAEGRAEGLAEGRAEGRAEGLAENERMLSLIHALLLDNRAEEVLQLKENHSDLEQLYAEYHL